MPTNQEVLKWRGYHCIFFLIFFLCDFIFAKVGANIYSKLKKVRVLNFAVMGLHS